MKRHFKNPIVRKLNDSEFKDTSNAEDFNAIYGSLDDIGLELEDILQYLQDFDSEESAYLINKLSKVRKYFRKDAKGGYTGQIKKYSFFSKAKEQKESEVFNSINRLISTSIKKINDKYSKGK